MRIQIQCCLLLTAAILTGCGTTPSTVRLPTVVTTNSSADPNEARYRLGEKATDPLLSQATGTVLPIEKTYGSVLAQVRAHQVLWQKESDELAKGVDGLNNTQFAGAVLGAIGVLANSIDVGKGGAAIAGGAGIWVDRYKLSVQSSNYRVGANAMQCVFKSITAIPEGFWEATYVDKIPAEYGKMRFNRSFYVASSKDQAAASKGFDALKGLFVKVHETILDIRSRLGDVQRSVKLTSPSGNEIAGALKAKLDSGKTTEIQSNALKDGAAKMVASNATGAKLNQLRVLTTANVPDAEAKEAALNVLALDEETLQQALQLPLDLDTCSKLIGP
ncbi:hypothetical protein [Rhodoferax ferrireducens]|uniref:hypothetical protein n=1 Tax=Rhodoferax ferrireducens TaxID=192843 RepID=UPI00130022C5|nr:hypothetical protein [Rhodoferax ferrireducens]